MRSFLLAASVAFLLSACAGAGIIDPTRDYQREADVACRSIGASLEALAPYRQDLAPSVEATVQSVRVQSDPICTAETPPTGVDVATRLTSMAFDLLTAERSVR